jgi:hypothetical protein
MLIKTKESLDRPSGRRLPLQAFLIVPFVLQVFAAVGLTGYISLRNGQQAVNDLAMQLRNEVSDRIKQNLSSYLAVPHQITQTNATAVKLGHIKMQNSPDLFQYLWEQYDLYGNQVSGTAMGSDENDFVVVESVEGKDHLITRLSDRSTNYALNSYALTKDGSRGKQTSTRANFDVHVRPWFKEAIAARKPVWGSVYPPLL